MRSATKAMKELRDALGAVFVGVLAGLLLYLGFSTPAQAGRGDEERVFFMGQRIPLIGRDLNGSAWSPDNLEGRRVLWVNLDTAQSPDGESLSLLLLHRSIFMGIRQNGRLIFGRGMVGATLLATLDDGSLLPLTIEDVVRDREDRLNRELRHYYVTYEDGGEQFPLCGVDEEGEPIPAIPVNGRWNQEEGVPGGGAYHADEGAITFACEGFAVAKCVMAGYKPWKKVLVCKSGQGCELKGLDKHLQACTRLLRADFCGDGRSFTEGHVWVNMYDSLGVRVDADDWLAEAEWNEDGALCMRRERIAGLVPDCAAYLLADECAAEDHSDLGALLTSEVMPAE